MGEKVVNGSTTTSKGLRGVHPRALAGAGAGARATRARPSSVRSAGGTSRATGTARVSARKSSKSPAEIHDTRMKNLRKAQRVRRKNIKEGRKMGANKPKRK